MNELINNYEYTLAWTVYVLAGVGCTAVWWQITALLNHRGWQDLLRGIVIVLIFSPWYISADSDHMAPALYVLVMDLLLVGGDSGKQPALILLFASFAMLITLTVRMLLRRRSN